MVIIVVSICSRRVCSGSSMGTVYRQASSNRMHRAMVLTCAGGDEGNHMTACSSSYILMICSTGFGVYCRIIHLYCTIQRVFVAEKV